ncbi:sugar ABC transporter permease [Brachybacterium sp. NBEC-018]|uniref:ABC transporter permease n=1 Tax=Brachybacterium sp. NBEC-018 TaxID=2996004 RepID=UPI0021751C26|nr:sugar ABC transporter permease [Brachybacterium sp. NBEC-018]UVY84960.1 sugar ABC transporter permease [Brachybacterium sp. NBEC-018]
MVADPVTDLRAPGTDLAAAAPGGPSAPGAGAAPRLTPRKRPLAARLWRYRALYLMAVPGIVYFLVFKYVPMGGLIIAFQDYKPFLGILGSPWVGFEHFVRLFTDDTFFRLLRNTLVLSLLLMAISFPVPVVLALLLNELRSRFFQRTVQTIIYIPHFMSWVIVVSIFYVMLTTDGGAINNLIVSLGGQSIGFLTDPDWLRPMYVFQHIWRTAGWGTIVYLAALTAVDPNLYEAAEIDGANRWRQTWHITLPAIRPTIIVLFILSIGDFLELGFEHMFLLLNSMNREVGDIFDTFVYTAGIQNGQLSFATAVGLFKGLVGLILVIGANSIAKRLGEEGVY